MESSSEMARSGRETSDAISTASSTSSEHGHSANGNSKFMKSAIDSAREGSLVLKEGGPFGACIVKNGEIIAVTHNQVMLNLDPTCHAEMQCIRAASAALKTNNLSCCQLYTTCEPCPMCLGACHWSRIGVIFIGCTRTTAARYGFDDDFIYQELDVPCAQRKLVCKPAGCKASVVEHFRKTQTYRRRMLAGGGILLEMYGKTFGEVEVDLGEEDGTNEQALSVMEHAMQISHEGQRLGENKEVEPFGAVVVRNGEVIAKAYHRSTVCDPTCTAEVTVIRDACRQVGLELKDCELYCTAEPDLMSLGAVYWARMKAVHFGVSRQTCASLGFEERHLHYEELKREFSDRVIDMTFNVMVPECEQVFAEWQKVNGQIY